MSHRKIILTGKSALPDPGPPNCTHCGLEATLTDGSTIYPHRPDLHHKFFWLCPCSAYVGCHPNTSKALGTPANRELRQARNRAHELFDKLWKYREGHKERKQAREEAYAWMREQMGMTRDECHFAMMTTEQCEKAILAVKVRMERFK